MAKLQMVLRDAILVSTLVYHLIEFDQKTEWLNPLGNELKQIWHWFGLPFWATKQN